MTDFHANQSPNAARKTNRARRGFLRRAFAAAALFGATVASTAAPAAAQGAYTAPSQRACILFMTDLDSPNQTWIQRQFYNMVEFGAESATFAALSGKYGSITVVKGQNATKQGLISALLSRSINPTVNSIDLMFVTHGLSDKVAFSDGNVAMTTLRNDICAQIPSSLRKKFRMVFSTACYGESHRSGWVGAGFEMASGSRRIYADSALSYPVFLGAWGSGMTFAQSINFANQCDPADLQDQTAKLVLQSWGYSKWWDVDSYRLRSGRTWLRIYQRPY